MERRPLERGCWSFVLSLRDVPGGFKGMVSRFRSSALAWAHSRAGDVAGGEQEAEGTFPRPH